VVFDGMQEGSSSPGGGQIEERDSLSKPEQTLAPVNTENVLAKIAMEIAD